MPRRFASILFLSLIASSLGAGPSIFDEPPTDNGRGKPGPASQPARDGGDLPSGAKTSFEATTTGVRNAYANEIAQTHSPATSAALFKKLLKVSDSTRDLPRQLALLQVARDVAVTLGDLPSSSDAVNRIDLLLHRDGSAAGASAPNSVLRSDERTELARKNAAAAWRAAEWADLVEQRDLALSLSTAAQRSAGLARDPRQIEKADAIVARLTEMKSASEAAAAAALATRKDPNNHAAYAVIGKFECFNRGQWETGLPKLAGSDDPVLEPLAILDLTHPSHGEDQVTLGDGWCRVAEKLAPLQRAIVYAHAVSCYQMALPSLTGLQRQRVTKTLSDIDPQSVFPPLDPDDGTEILNTMTGGTTDPASGIVTIVNVRPRLTSNRTFRPPVRFRIVAMTDHYNIRIGYAANEIIFNWEGNVDELRIGGGPANGRNAPGMGRVPAHQWVTIDMCVLPTSMMLFVDGQQRYEAALDFSQIDQPFTLFTEWSVMRVKSVRVIGE